MPRIPVIAVRGGVAEVEVGDAVIVDFDNITDDPQAGRDALEALRGRRDVKYIRDTIVGIWPELRRAR